MTPSNKNTACDLGAGQGHRATTSRPRTLRRSAIRARQGGMGATIVLFTIALIVLVGAALAYAGRGNPSAINAQGAKVYGSVILKQSADYRDAYSRFVFDGGNASTMTFHVSPFLPGDLFNPAAQYGIYQAPPPQAIVGGTPTDWAYNNNVLVNGVGTATGAESVVYITDVTDEVCIEINNQLYGLKTIPAATIASGVLGTGGTAFDASPAGRSTGCFKTSDAKNVIYSTLGES